MGNDLRFHHVVDLPRLGSQMATARDSRNRIHIYFIVKEGPVYKRNGLKGTWEPVEQNVQHSVRQLLARSANRINRYSTNSSMA